MIKIGLTGNAGSGKSTVRSIVQNLGIPCLDADRVAHQIYETHPQLVVDLVHQFGESILQDGRLHRPALAEIVFKDSEALHTLNQMVHPIVFEDIQSWVEQHESLGERVVLIEATLILENNRKADYDSLWVVVVEPELQERRLLERGWSKEQIQSRLSQQLPQTQKQAQADLVLKNSSTLSSLESQVRAGLNQLSISK